MVTLGETSVLTEFQISNDLLRKRCVRCFPCVHARAVVGPLPPYESAFFTLGVCGVFAHERVREPVAFASRHMTTYAVSRRFREAVSILRVCSVLPRVCSRVGVELRDAYLFPFYFFYFCISPLSRCATRVGFVVLVDTIVPSSCPPRGS